MRSWKQASLTYKPLPDQSPGMDGGRRQRKRNRTIREKEGGSEKGGGKKDDGELKLSVVAIMSNFAKSHSALQPPGEAPLNQRRYSTALTMPTRRGQRPSLTGMNTIEEHGRIRRESIATPGMRQELQALQAAETSRLDRRRPTLTRMFAIYQPDEPPCMSGRYGSRVGMRGSKRWSRACDKEKIQKRMDSVDSTAVS